MAIDATTFSWVADLIKAEAAIALEPGKEYLVESRLSPLAAAAGASSVDEYVRNLRNRPIPSAKLDIVEAMTTNETSWFRDREPFDALVQQILPDLLSRPNPTRQIKIWSAACSSGQEAYTISMLMQEHLPPGWSYSILATDISRQMLDRVERAEYNQLEVGRGLPAQMMVNSFERVGTHWKVKEQVRRPVSTQFLNLAQPFPTLPQFDVVFLRNVLIYFEVPVKADILNRVRRTTKPGGYLFLGAAETTIGLDDNWERRPAGRSTLIRNPDPTGPAPQLGAAPSGAGAARALGVQAPMRTAGAATAAPARPGAGVPASAARPNATGLPPAAARPNATGLPPAGTTRPANGTSRPATGTARPANGTTRPATGLPSATTPAAARTTAPAATRTPNPAPTTTSAPASRFAPVTPGSR